MTLPARTACETGRDVSGHVDFGSGYIAMLGMSDKSYALRVIQSGPRAIMIPAEQCGGAHVSDARSSYFIIAHSFLNRNGIREGYYYLTNRKGELLNAVHFQEGRSHLFAYANSALPVRRADFESEKTNWIAATAEIAKRNGR